MDLIIPGKPRRRTLGARVFGLELTAELNGGIFCGLGRFGRGLGLGCSLGSVVEQHGGCAELVGWQRNGPGFVMRGFVMRGFVTLGFAGQGFVGQGSLGWGSVGQVSIWRGSVWRAVFLDGLTGRWDVIRNGCNGSTVDRFSRRAGTDRGAALGGRAIFRLLVLARFGLLHFQQALPIGNRDLVIIGVDFAKGQKAVSVAAVFDKCCLQARLYPDDLRQVDIALKLAFGRGFYIVFIKPIAVQHDNTRFLRVGAVDQHTFGHACGSSVRPRLRAV